MISKENFHDNSFEKSGTSDMNLWAIPIKFKTKIISLKYNNDSIK